MSVQFPQDWQTSHLLRPDHPSICLLLLHDNFRPPTLTHHERDLPNFPSLVTWVRSRHSSGSLTLETPSRRDSQDVYGRCGIFVVFRLVGLLVRFLGPVSRSLSSGKEDVTGSSRKMTVSNCCPRYFLFTNLRSGNRIVSLTPHLHPDLLLFTRWSGED